MGSLTTQGLPVSQSGNVLRFHHNGNALRRSNTLTDTTTSVSNSGVTERQNYTWPFGHDWNSSGRSFVSGLSVTDRELRHNTAVSGDITRDEFLRNVSSNGNLQHVVTRAMGIHVSISNRESPNTALGAMSGITSEKKFFLDSDRGKTSGFADWNIFNASGIAVGTDDGTTDVDSTPEPTYDA